MSPQWVNKVILLLLLCVFSLLSLRILSLFCVSSLSVLCVFSLCSLCSPCVIGVFPMCSHLVLCMLSLLFSCSLCFLCVLSLFFGCSLSVFLSVFWVFYKSSNRPRYGVQRDAASLNIHILFMHMSHSSRTPIQYYLYIRHTPIEP